MKEEGIDLRIVMMQTTSGLHALVSGHVQLSSAGTSAFVAVGKGSAPLKTVLALNDKVHQWIIGRPGVATFKDLKGKKLGIAILASSATFMIRQLAPKQDIDPNKDIKFVNAGMIDAMIGGNEDRYAALDSAWRP